MEQGSVPGALQAILDFIAPQFTTGQLTLSATR
jgi:hypothetical protein